VSSLLSAQIQHLREAEKNLPLRYRSEKYVNAIKTEGEASEYIRDVTEAIHKGHGEAAAQRVKRALERKRGLEIAAVAERPSPKRRGVAMAKPNATKGGRKR
jgi:hypothetical protein